MLFYRSKSYISMGEMCLNGNVIPNYILTHLRTIYPAPKNVSFITGVVGIFLLGDFKMDFQLDTVSDCCPDTAAVYPPGTY